MSDQSGWHAEEAESAAQGNELLVGDGPLQHEAIGAEEELAGVVAHAVDDHGLADDAAQHAFSIPGVALRPPGLQIICVIALGIGYAGMDQHAAAKLGGPGAVLDRLDALYDQPGVGLADRKARDHLGRYVGAIAVELGRPHAVAPPSS